MPASAKTPNFDLPQYRNLDTVSMLVTFNGAMQKIDTALQNIKTTADVGSTDIDDLQQSVDRLTTEVAALNQGLRNLGWRKQTLHIYSENTAEYNAWTNNNGELLLSFGTSFNTPTLPKIPNANGDGSYLWAFCTTPDNIFNITENDVIYYVGHVALDKAEVNDSVYSPSIYRYGVSRSNNITYIGLWTKDVKDFRFALGNTGILIKIQKS